MLDVVGCDFHALNRTNHVFKVFREFYATRIWWSIGPIQNEQGTKWFLEVRTCCANSSQLLSRRQTPSRNIHAHALNKRSTPKEHWRITLKGSVLSQCQSHPRTSCLTCTTWHLESSPQYAKTLRNAWHMVERFHADAEAASINLVILETSSAPGTLISCPWAISLTIPRNTVLPGTSFEATRQPITWHGRDGEGTRGDVGEGTESESGVGRLFDSCLNMFTHLWHLVTFVTFGNYLQKWCCPFEYVFPVHWLLTPTSNVDMGCNFRQDQDLPAFRCI